MSRSRYRWLTTTMAVLVVLGLGAIAHACNVPVFRFALEQWRPDPYRVIVFHRGKLSDAERDLIKPLEEQQDNSQVNIAVRTVDLANEESSSEEVVADRALYEALGKPTLPWLVVQYPLHLRIPKPAWAGSLTREVVATAIDSPIRRELANRLAAGQTAVWLFLESGESDKDDAAVAMLEEQLKELEKSLQLPELTDSPADALATTLPLEIKFSLLRVPRKVAAEHGLVAMLIGSEPDLAERTDAMVFPVFGRGRALLPLIGDGITPQNIRDAASFLTGPCSCEVKEQNPGFDLMLAVDWDSLLAQNGVALTAVETRSPPPASLEPELVPIPSGSSPPTPTATATNIKNSPLTPADALHSTPVGVFASNRAILILGSLVTGVLLIGLIVLFGQTRRV
jgi:hypothetical protein